MVAFCILSCGDTAAVQEQILLEEYLQTNRINATKNGSFYYTIDTSSLVIDSLQEVPTSSNLVSVHLQGSLVDGLVFADSKISDTGSPLTLGLNTNLLLGLKQGLLLFPKYSSGTLYLPPSLAYGDAGDIGRDIPPEAIVIYKVEMNNIYVSETAYNDSLIQQYLKERDLIPDTVISSVQVFFENKGNSTFPDDNSIVELSNTISSLNDELFVEYTESNPNQIDLNTSISGLEEALPLFGIGGVGTLIIPSQEAYGSKGNDTIPGYTPLVFEFKLLDIIE